jgi:hybrid cluster-associated redox disulfide protein
MPKEEAMVTVETLEALSVAEVLERWPNAVPLFLEYRMACVGCPLAPFERLADAIAIYHLDRDSFLRELVSIIRSTKTE